MREVPLYQSLLCNTQAIVVLWVSNKSLTDKTRTWVRLIQRYVDY